MDHLLGIMRFFSPIYLLRDSFSPESPANGDTSLQLNIGIIAHLRTFSQTSREQCAQTNRLHSSL